MASHQVLKERYEIKKILGQRSGHQTLLALDRETQSSVVVKLLLFGGNLQWQTYRLFEREAQTLKELQNQAIPRYLDYFDIETKQGKGFALVQSYIDALSLEEHIKQGRIFSEAELKQIARAILEILNYLHNRYPPIIHRDLKPSNILLTNRSGNSVGEIYLVDFGSVQAAASDVGTKTVVGTYGFMPPEQFGGRAVPASDIYGLGTTIIYLASGQHPADLPQKDLRVSFENAVNLSPRFTDWLQLLIEPSLDRRLSSAEKALEALDNLVLQKCEPLPSFVKKPASRINLIKKQDVLEICLSPHGLTSILIRLILVTIIWNGIIGIFCVFLRLIWIAGGWTVFGVGWILLIIFTVFIPLCFGLALALLVLLTSSSPSTPKSR